MYLSLIPGGILLPSHKPSPDAHRIGQDKQVIAYRFITQNSIEERILQLQEDKRRLAETFITDSEALPALSNEQWADLLK
mgnify:CR=1 FL=1